MVKGSVATHLADLSRFADPFFGFVFLSFPIAADWKCSMERLQLHTNAKVVEYLIYSLQGQKQNIRSGWL